MGYIFSPARWPYFELRELSELFDDSEEGATVLVADPETLPGAPPITVSVTCFRSLSIRGNALHPKPALLGDVPGIQRAPLGFAPPGDKCIPDLLLCSCTVNGVIGRRIIPASSVACHLAKLS